MLIKQIRLQYNKEFTYFLITKRKLKMINQSNNSRSFLTSNKNLQSQSCSSQSLENNILILKEEIKSLTVKNRQLQTYNQQLLTDLAESKQKQNKLKQLNNILTNNLKDYSPNVHQSIKLTLEGEFMSKRILELEQELEKYQNGVHQSVQRRVKKIVGEFTEQQELDYSKKASRLISKKSQTHNHNISHNHYKIQYNKGNNSQSQNEKSYDKQDSVQSSMIQKYQINIHQQAKAICPKCQSLAQQLQQSFQHTKQIQKQLQQILQQLKVNQNISLVLKKQNESLKKQVKFLKTNNRKNDQSSQKEQMERYIQQITQDYEERLKELDHNWQIRYDNLLQQYQLLLDELNSYGSKRSNTQQYTVEQSPINWFKKKNVFQVKNQNDRQEFNSNNNRNQMLKDISNLVNGLGTARKQRQKQQNYLNTNQNYSRSRMTQKSNKSGSSSRISTTTETAMFTIKQGVNRPNKNTFY